MFRRVIALTIGLALLISVANAHAGEPETDAADRAVAYIEALQNDDGGFPAFGTESSPGATIDAAFALLAAGEDTAEVAQPDGVSLGAYVGSQTPPDADAGALAKLSYALTMLGGDGGAYVDEMDQYIDPELDAYGDDVFDEAFYVFALVAADAPRTASAAYLRSIQLDDGGWEFAGGFGSDTNTTAMALQALLAAGGGVGEAAANEAVAYFAAAQQEDGGFGFTAADASDANSTAMVIQALVAAGEDVDAWMVDGSTPMDALLSFQNADTGAFQYGGEDSPFATYQAVPALMLAPFPELETRGLRVPTPQGPTVIDPTETPALTPAVRVLPESGYGAPAREAPWIAFVVLLATGAASLVLGTLRLRRR